MCSGSPSRDRRVSAAAARTLVVDLRSRARSWALTDDAERALREAAPRGWAVVVVQAPTVPRRAAPPLGALRVGGRRRRALSRDARQRRAPHELRRRARGADRRAR